MTENFKNKNVSIKVLAKGGMVMVLEPSEH